MSSCQRFGNYFLSKFRVVSSILQGGSQRNLGGTQPFRDAYVSLAVRVVEVIKLVGLDSFVLSLLWRFGVQVVLALDGCRGEHKVSDLILTTKTY